MGRGAGTACGADQEPGYKVVRNYIIGIAWFILCIALHFDAQAKKHAAPPQPVPIQLDTWSLRTGDALDPNKRCVPPEFKYGQWWPMECPDNDVVYQ